MPKTAGLPPQEFAWQLDPISISTVRLRIRSFVDEDISSEYLGWLNNKEHMRYSNQRFIEHSIESAQEFLASFRSQQEQFLAVEQDSNLVGTATIYLSRHHGTADIGILIGTEFAGQGFGRETVAALSTELLDQGVRKITIGTSEGNMAMQHLLDGLGFQRDGTRPRQELVDGQECGLMYFAKFNPNWTRGETLTI